MLSEIYLTWIWIICILDLLSWEILENIAVKKTKTMLCSGSCPFPRGKCVVFSGFSALPQHTRNKITFREKSLQKVNLIFTKISAYIVMCIITCICFFDASKEQKHQKHIIPNGGFIVILSWYNEKTPQRNLKEIPDIETEEDVTTENPPKKHTDRTPRARQDVSLNVYNWHWYLGDHPS